MTRWLTSLALVLIGGCSHHSAELRQPPAAPGTESTPIPARAAAPACVVDRDCGPNQVCIHQQCLSVTPDLTECAMMRVHFSYDSAVIDAADEGSLERGARCLRGDHALQVTIEGSADERGTEAYSLALGKRRATAVSTWLVSRGTSDTQLATVRFGTQRR